MGFSVLLLIAAAGVIPTRLSLITVPVSVDGQGPFRFLVDTGAESTVMDPALAARLGLAPTYRVELVNANGARLTPALRLRSMLVEGRRIPEIEVLLTAPNAARAADSGIQGVLGANALAGLSYLLTPREGRLELEASRPAGAALPFEDLGGRVVIKPSMAGEPLALMLDSGASHLVLFKMPASMAKTAAMAARLTTLDGARAAAAVTWSQPLAFDAGLTLRTVPAAVVEQPGRSFDGLLPAGHFEKVYVDRARGEVVLVRPQ
ncbi:MAG: hypothetical protein FJW40_11825 [Acidobacteria bacterium]|nr:hypothetical protein [Acidobacteriota bacterium]